MMASKTGPKFFNKSRASNKSQASNIEFSENMTGLKIQKMTANYIHSYFSKRFIVKPKITLTIFYRITKPLKEEASTQARFQ